MMEAQVNDDRPNQGPEFDGARLEIHGPETRENVPSVDFKGPSLSQGKMNRSMSVGSGSGRRPNFIMTDYSLKSYFCYRDGSFENAVEACKESVVSEDLDGQLRGAWLLTEIDHWDAEKEKMVLLTENSLLIIKYDFVAIKMLRFRRVMLHLLDTIEVGEIVYPDKSIMPPRQHGGVRLLWTKGKEISASLRWNPWKEELPYITLTDHPISYHPKEAQTITYRVDNFMEALVQAVNQARPKKNIAENIPVEERSIMVESYGSIYSMICNQSHLGFSRERNGMSF
ncbi:tumor protein p63-regulated gene 1-like protein [Lingula anatina]|uniref:Tumor protein p63-regulated gene 1-like protein n=1 Tax=Lingula anatina TaxID=7574 RepID=A0A1S3JCB8_LINAN|nr:tumor protein p63-regulated gene 1-like protein [Lingula anatina]|eukprot:XP_013407831.1 tumor protein p63-regulated gene 1-like protein [Lingula anatina]